AAFGAHATRLEDAPQEGSAAYHADQRVRRRRGRLLRARSGPLQARARRELRRSRSRRRGATGGGAIRSAHQKEETLAGLLKTDRKAKRQDALAFNSGLHFPRQAASTRPSGLATRSTMLPALSPAKSELPAAGTGNRMLYVFVNGF